MDRDLSANPLSFITCRQCPQSSGLSTSYPDGDSTQRSIWQCRPCQHFAMTYRRGRCTCPFPEWVAAGDSCVRASDMNELESNQYRLSEAQQITYQSIIKDNGDLTSQTVT